MSKNKTEKFINKEQAEVSECKIQIIPDVDVSD
jgi:hypothetical protein